MNPVRGEGTSVRTIRKGENEAADMTYVLNVPIGNGKKRGREVR